MFTRIILAAGLLTAAAFAQDQMLPMERPNLAFPQALRDYLQLTSEQATALTRMNAEYDTLTMRKQLRVASVNREIAEETARDQLDTMALGLRYAELEQIRRELKDSHDRVREKARALLNPAQLASLKMLEDAARLQPLIQSGICENLLDPAALQPQLTGALTGDFAQFILRTSVIPASRLQVSTGCARSMLMPLP